MRDEKLNVKSKFELNDGTCMPVIGLGTWEARGDDVGNAVFCALKAGYRHIDTAAIYGNEAEVGAAINRAISELGIARSDIYVTTKLWNSNHDDVEGAFSKSLKLLGLDYVDLYLMHFPVRSRVKSWHEMEKIKESGRAKSIGVSNFTINHLNELLLGCKIRPAVNQVELTPLLYQRDLVDFCQKNSILVQAYSPIMRGQRLDDVAFVKIAKKHFKTVPQIILRWCIQHKMVPLPKSVTPARIEENLAIFDFELSTSEMNELDSLNEDFRLCWDPTDAP